MNHEKDIHENGRFHGHGQDFDLRCPPVDFSADGERTRFLFILTRFTSTYISI